MRDEKAEVSAEDAYGAAAERASRTQLALILAEAQIIALRRRCAEAEERAERAEVERLKERLKGVEHGAEGGGGASAVGEAGSAGPVPA